METKDVKECTDCGTPINPNDENWRFWKYEPNIPLCDSCFDNRMDEEQE